MKDIDKYIKLISKLNRLTKEEHISWEKTSPPYAMRVGVDDVFVDFFKTIYADTCLGIGEVRYQSYSGDFDKYYWAQKIVFVFLDSDGELEYELPTIEGSWNLLETIRRTVSEVDSIVDHLINSSDDEQD